MGRRKINSKDVPSSSATAERGNGSGSDFEEERPLSRTRRNVRQRAHVEHPPRNSIVIEENPLLPQIRKKFLKIPINWEKTFEKDADTKDILAPYVAMGRAQQWDRIMTMDVKGYSDMVKEFYLQLYLSGDDDIVTIRGKKIPFTRATLEVVFELFPFGSSDCPIYNEDAQFGWAHIADTILKRGGVFGMNAYGKRRVHYKHLKPQLRPWVHFMCSTIFGIAHHYSFGEEGARVLACIAEKRIFDLPRMIVENVKKFKRSPLTTTALRHPALITALCLHYGVPVNGEAIKDPSGTRITATTVSWMLDEANDEEREMRDVSPGGNVDPRRARVAQRQVGNVAPTSGYGPMEWNTERLNNLALDVRDIRDQQNAMRSTMQEFMERTYQFHEQSSKFQEEVLTFLRHPPSPQ